MEAFAYYDLTTKRAYSSPQGGQPVNLPTLVAGESLRFHTWYRENRGGTVAEATPNIRAMKAVLGVVDQRPTSGTFKLDVDGETTAAITYSSTDATFASNIKTALEALAGITDVTVTVRDGSFIIVFEDDNTIERTITIVANRLHPVSFVRVRTYARGGVYEHELRCVVAPVAYASTFELEGSIVPTITTLREGTTVDDTVISEIQALYIPPNFNGTFRVVRDGTHRSDPLSRKSTIENIKDAMEDLLDPGGEWIITNPVDHYAYIEFGGDMAGENQTQMTIEVFQAPTEAHVVTLDTKTREMADLMQANDVSALTLEIHAEIEDPDDEGTYTWHTIYRTQVTVREAVDWDELATAPNIDWLRPPTHFSYNAFSPGQVSNGQLHYTTTFGDGAASTFAIAHGLDVTNVQLIVTENATPGDFMVAGTDYTWTRDSTNQVTITWLGTTPTAAQYLVTVLGLEQTSYFDAHTHLISEVDGLQDWMDSIEARMAQLESNTGGTIGTETGSEEEEAARWTLPTVWELYPSKTQPSRPESGALADVDPLEEADGKPVIGRAKGLLPAVHDATVESLPNPIPAASSTYQGKVYQNDGSARVLIPGSLGNRSVYAEVGDYVACDGRLWYPVEKYGNYVAHAITSDYATDADLFTFADIVEGEFLAEDTVVTLTTTDTLPTGLLAGTNYRVRNPDFEAGTFALCLDSDDTNTAIAVSDDGTGTHSINVATEISYYPRHFERTLFTLHVNGDQFRARKDFDLAFALEAAILKSNTEAQWSLMIEIGEARQETSVGTEGVNMKEIVWRKIPALEQRIVLTAVSTTHRFGCRISRRVVGGVDTITMQNLKYGLLIQGAVPPVGPNFAIRARLGRFDTDDNETDPRGFVILSAPKPVQAGSNSEASGDSSEFEYGFAVVK